MVHGYEDFPVVVDSPMAIEATTIFREHYKECFDEEALQLVESGINPIAFSGLQLSITSDESKAINFNEQPKVTHTTYMDTRLNFSPGLTVFMMENVSFNVSFGVFGLYMRNEKQVTDGVESGNRFTSGANFKFNIFNINFFFFYFICHCSYPLT